MDAAESIYSSVDFKGENAVQGRACSGRPVVIERREADAKAGAGRAVRGNAPGEPAPSALGSADARSQQQSPARRQGRDGQASSAASSPPRRRRGPRPSPGWTPRTH